MDTNCYGLIDRCRISNGRSPMMAVPPTYRAPTLPACLLSALLLILPVPRILQAADTTGALPDDLTGLSLEALMNVEVTSVSKKAE